MKMNGGNSLTGYCVPSGRSPNHSKPVEPGAAQPPSAALGVAAPLRSPSAVRAFNNPNGRGTGPNHAKSRLLSTSHVRSTSLLVNAHRNASEQASLRRGCSDFDQHASHGRWYVLEVVRLAHTDDLSCEAW